MNINWNVEKNDYLRKNRGIGFEYVEQLILQGNIISIEDHPNKEKYPRQKIIIFRYKEYVYYCPFIQKGNTIFLKTIIPSRKLHKKYSLTKK